jgi:hypothetical protein
MDIKLIENKIGEIIVELEREVMEVVSDETIDKQNTNLRLKPLATTKQILINAIDSIKMVNNLNIKS